MPYSIPRIVPQTRGSSDAGRTDGSAPVFGTAVRWCLRVLAWLAFGVAGYLAWHAVGETSVAGCGVGSENGCDVVLTSSWSKWLGIPVAIAGLACYSTLATLSIFLGVRNTEMNRWISTAFVMLSIVAAGASLWFIGVQIFVIHDYCKFCLVTDACGIALGVIATTFATRSYFANRATPRSAALQPGMMGLRRASPAGGRPAPVMATADTASPALGVALGGALPLLALLIGGQLLFAAKTYDVQKVALSDSIKMGDTGADETNESSTATTRVAMRPTDGEPSPDDKSVEKPDATTADDNAAEPTVGRVSRHDAPSVVSTPPPVEAPTRHRPMKFLAGKLALDVYQHAIIGSPDAPHIAIEMVSYDCSHCRKMHVIVQDALARYGNDVALLVMFLPQEQACNKLVTDPAASHRGACTTARMALGIAKLNPPAFNRFHDFLMTGKDKPPGMDRVIPKAYGLVDRDKLRQLIRSPEIEKQIAGYIDLYSQLETQNRGNKKFGLPLQILGDHVMTGDVENPEDVYKAWEEYLGVKPK